MRGAVIAAFIYLLAFSVKGFLPVAHGSADAYARDSNSADNSELKILSLGKDAGLAIYSPEKHTFFVYPSPTQGAGKINCEYSLHIEQLGGQLIKENCAPGAKLP